MVASADPAVNQALKSIFAFVKPEIVLLVTACVLFLVATYRFVFVVRRLPVDPSDSPSETSYGNAIIAGIISLTGIVAAALVTSLSPPSGAFNDTLTVLAVRPDGLSSFITWIALISGAVLVLMNWSEVGDRYACEYQGCLLIAVAGFSLIGKVNDLIILFLALELISIPTYIMLYLPRTNKLVLEACIKYFLLSIFSSAFLLLGFSYFYGVVGTTNLTALLQAFREEGVVGLPLVTILGLVLIIVGLGFKITAVPFHFYAPDVYQGASTGPVAVLAYIPKFAGFLALLRALGYIAAPQEGGMPFGTPLTLLLWLMAILTMTLGNVLALYQDNLRRLMAYSGIAQGGYMLIGLAAAPALQYALQGGEIIAGGTEAVIFYMITYGLMTVGIFTALAYLDSPERPVETVDDLAGLQQSHPGIAAAIALFLFSLIGLPLTAGFVGKLLLFSGAMAVGAEQGIQGNAVLFRTLAIIAVINAAIAAYYYLRIVSVMYFRTAISPIVRPASSSKTVALWVCAVLTVGLGVYPAPLLNQMRQVIFPSERVQQADVVPVPLENPNRAG